LPRPALTLDDGDFFDFGFFKVIPTGAVGGTFSPLTSTAKIIFSDPASQEATFEITISDDPSNFIQFTPSDTITLADRTFVVDLIVSLAQESSAFLPTATVNARLTQLSSGTAPSVPDAGSTAMLLSLGFLALALASRSRLIARR
jgi:hypothetical protein